MAALHVRFVASIEEIGLYLSGLMQNGADEDEARLLCVKHCVSLKAEAAKAGRDFGDGPADAGKAGEQIERAFKSGVIGFGLIRSEGFLSAAVNLDKVLFRLFRKAEFSHVGLRRVDAQRLIFRAWLPW